jgi:hypothetical protein
LPGSAFGVACGLDGSDTNDFARQPGFMRTLIVAPNWIGDAVMAQPLVALLARSDPDGPIDALAPPHIAP